MKATIMRLEMMMSEMKAKLDDRSDVTQASSVITPKRAGSFAETTVVK